MERQMATSKLIYDTHEVATLLGRHVNDVLRLIKAKRLEASRMNVRGTRGRGRLVVKARELERFVDSLPAADPEPVEKARRSSKPRPVGAGEIIEIC
jgi:hypothetical protein